MILEKKKKSITIDTIDIWDLDGMNLQQVSDLFKEYEDKQYESIQLVVDTNFYDGEDGYAQIDIKGLRLETDAELEIRQKEHDRTELSRYLKDREIFKKRKEQLEKDGS